MIAGSKQGYRRRRYCRLCGNNLSPTTQWLYCQRCGKFILYLLKTDGYLQKVPRCGRRHRPRLDRWNRGPLPDEREVAERRAAEQRAMEDN